MSQDKTIELEAVVVTEERVNAAVRWGKDGRLYQAWDVVLRGRGPNLPRMEQRWKLVPTEGDDV